MNKKKKKVWKDVDKVVKASTVPRRLKGLKIIMEDIPKHDKKS